MMTMKVFITMLEVVLFFLGFVEDVTAASLNLTTTTQGPLSSPCPCIGQPAGTVISHPSDCKAYYTCLGGSEVLFSRCPKQDEFFHPYVRSCVDRSTIVSFVPDFIPTKDICKITSVFPAPAMEDLDNCIIKDEGNTANDTSSDEIFLRRNSDTDTPTTTATPELNQILNLFPWMTSRTPVLKHSSAVSATELPFQRNTHNQSPPLTTSTTQTCKLAKVIIHHFPGPCRADITCENGVTLTIDKCQSSFSFVQM